MAGPQQTGFGLYDRADPPKSFLFVEGACHNKFNLEWYDHDLYEGYLTDEGKLKVLSTDAHQRIVKAYANAFFQWHLYEKNEMSIFFTGNIIPKQVAASDGGNIVIHTQYQSRGGLLIDRFSHYADDKNYKKVFIGS